VATTEDDPINDKPMPLLEHLIELRTRLIWSMVAFGVCFAISYYFSDQIYYFLARPLAESLRATGNPDPKLIYTQLYEAFFVRIKVAVFGGGFGCSWHPACIGARSAHCCRSSPPRRYCS
jgi:sec-independent protein translocase protein TatC